MNRGCRTPPRAAAALRLVTMLLLGCATACSSPKRSAIRLPPLRELTVPLPRVTPEESSEETPLLPISQPPLLEMLAVRCGELAKTPLASQATPLLWGALRYYGFEQQRLGAAGLDAIWLEAEAHETRVPTHLAEDQFVVVARDLFQLVEGDDVPFEQAAAAYLRRVHRVRAPVDQLARVPMRNGLRAVALIPGRIYLDGQRSLALGMLVAQPDGRTHHLGFYVSRHLHDRGCIDLALAVGATLEPGQKAPLRKARTAELPLSPFKLSIELPGGWQLGRHPVSGGKAVSVHKLAPLGQYPGQLRMLVSQLTAEQQAVFSTTLATLAPGQTVEQVVVWRRDEATKHVNAKLLLNANTLLTMDVSATSDDGFLEVLKTVANSIARE